MGGKRRYCNPAARWGLVLLTMSCASAPRYHGPTGNAATTSRLPTDGPVLYEQVGVSSFYADKFHGRPTASGEIFDMLGISAAHRELPLGTVARVTNLRNNRSIVLRINDRGPFIDGRILDVSYGAAQKLGFVVDGLTEVKIEVLRWGAGR